VELLTVGGDHFPMLGELLPDRAIVRCGAQRGEPRDFAWRPSAATISRSYRSEERYWHHRQPQRPAGEVSSGNMPLWHMKSR
jgi:hypothetical protein